MHEREDSLSEQKSVAIRSEFYDFLSTCTLKMLCSAILLHYARPWNRISLNSHSHSHFIETMKVLKIIQWENILKKKKYVRKEQ